MAARSKRAVRVDPGAAADRRASAGKRRSLSSELLLHPAHFDEDTSTAGEAHLENPKPATLVSQRLSPEPTLVDKSRVSNSLPPSVRKSDRERPVALNSRPRITVNDPYAVLYGLEYHRGTFEMLPLLHQEGSATMTRFRQRLRPAQRTLQRTLLFLTRAGLVRLARPRSFPFAKTYRLTDLGKELVETPIRAWSYVLVE